MSAGVSIMGKRPAGARFGGAYSGFFSFTSPLSKEVWTCILGCIVGVSIVIFIVSRYKISEMTKFFQNKILLLDSHNKLEIFNLLFPDFLQQNGQLKTVTVWLVEVVQLSEINFLSLIVSGL